MIKTFDRNGRSLSIEIKKQNSKIIIIGSTEKDGKKLVRSSLFPIQKGEKIFDAIQSFEGAEKVFYHLGSSPRTEMQNPKVNPSWEKLKEVCAPQEGPNETYIFDEKSSGIYTPVLEGIAHKNPRRPTSDGYMKLASQAHDDFHANKEKDSEVALRSLMKAYRLYDLASHVAYFHNAKKVKGEFGSDKKVIESLLKLQDEKITRLREDIFTELQNFIGDLEANKQQNIVRKVSSEFTLNKHEEKEDKAPRKFVKRTLAEQVKLRSDRVSENRKRVKDLEEEVEIFKKALKRPNLHESDKERLASLLENAELRLRKIVNTLIDDKKVVEAAKKSIDDEIERRELEAKQELEKESERTKQGSLLKLAI